MARPEYTLPIPIADAESEPFYRGAKDRKLMLVRCTGCGTWRMPGRGRCVDCWSEDWQWAEASGQGKLYSFGVMHQLYHPAFADALPYNFAVVELDEGPRIISNIIGCANDALRVDMPLIASYDDVSEETTLVRFKPVDE